ncbi:MAG: CHC2 zinc finger domain-containing protein [Deltaproteobacteria bacterium]|nr:CHC2 zinc finger domain-containing protein [Deltaproteobacteria bacterium]
MSRFPQADLDALKATIDVVAVVGAIVDLEKRGDDLVGRCPFHDDKTPSFFVTPHKGLWHCFGKCRKGGDVIAFVMQHQGVSFRHAVELLKAKTPLSSTPPKGSSRVPKLPSPVKLDAEKHEALAQVAAYYCSTLKESTEALKYLKSRGLMSSEMIDTFQLGYANRTLGLRLPASNRVDGEKLRGLLGEVGVFRESGHEHLAGSLVVPLFDEHHHVVGMYGRKIHRNLRAGTPDHLYLPGPHRGLFNEAALSSSSEVIVCEALLDALTFWCAGHRNVTSSYGVDGFTDVLLAALHRHQVKTILIAYDKDDAGDAAAAALAKKLEGEGFVVGRVVFPKGMDANEYAQKVKPATKSLGLALERAREELITSRKIVADKPTPRAAASVVIEQDRAPLTPTSAEIVTPAAATTTTTTTPTKPQPPHPLAAAPVPTSAPAKSSITMEVKDDEIAIVLGDRRYRVRGFAKNTSKDLLKVNLLVSRGDAFHVDTLDLYAARFRALFIKLAAHELRVEESVIKTDLGYVMLKLEELQDEDLRKLLTSGPAVPEMTKDEEDAALSLLRDPRLLERVLEDFTRCGVVGEETNKLMGYLGMTSRKLEKPLAIIIQSSSAAGKSALMDAVLAFCPEEERIKYSAMTGQSLFYMSGKDLKHKVLAVVEEEGAEKAAYSLKLLQSEGELIIASTGKDPETGKQMTAEYRVEGPVMLFLTTTAIEIDDELMNRCLVLTVDEDREQTRAIHRMQRERRTLQGRLLGRDRAAILKLHENAQRLLRAIAVVNPFANQLTFVDDRTRTRRDHMKYLGLIDTITLVHQHQREVKSTEHHGEPFEYIEVTLDDIALANKIAHVVLGRSLDELPPQTRKLLDVLDAYVTQLCAERVMERSSVRLTRREILDVSGLGLTQLRTHLGRLVDVEHVLVHAGARGQSFVYELLFDGGGKAGTPHLSGLLDVEALAAARATASWRGAGGPMAAPKRGVDGQTPANRIVDDKRPEFEANAGPSRKRTTEGRENSASHLNGASYPKAQQGD